jgi:hypothetical protein
MKKVFLAILVAASVNPALAASPTVVELYQSQGCSSCPPAIANVNALVDQPGVLVLTFAVTYWDRLGWKDTFAKPAFTSRQYDYERGLHHNSAFTPQVVVNGRSDLIGADRRELTNTIAHAAPVTGPDIMISKDVVSVSAGPAPGAADVWLVRYDPRALAVKIGAGENGGVTIAHRNVVRDLIRIGTWNGTSQSYRLPSSADPSWRSTILLQQKDGGPILGAKQMM